MRARRAGLAAVLALAAGLAPAAAQRVSIDRGVRVGELWCFPLVEDPRAYVYLPPTARLSTDEQGRPQFSFLRYVRAAAGAEDSASTIGAARGGGVLHFLVQLDTPAEAPAAAEQELRQRFADDEIRVRGPLVFDEGRFTLVSSILRPAAGAAAREVLAAGRAPVLEGNRLPFSFELDAERATLLLESLKTPTPDVSLLFDMTFSGLTDAYDAELIIDWEEVRHSQALSAGGTVYFVSADVELALERLRRDNAIRLVTRGADAHLEGLLDTVYQKLVELLFRPVEPERVPEANRGGLADALGALLDSRSGALSSRRSTGFGAYVGYQLKDLRSEGTSVLTFDHRAAVERHALVAFNVGDLWRRWGDDPERFPVVDLDDPTFQQREIRVGVDGAVAADFDRFVNNVTVTLRKRHAGGEETVREVVLDRGRLAAQGGDLRLVYGRRPEDGLPGWLDYETRTRWSFVGGGVWQTDWTPADAARIDVFAPYERRVIRLAGDGERLRRAGVRAVVVRLESAFLTGPQRQQVTLRPDDAIEELSFEVTLPRGTFDYGWTIDWQLEGGRRATAAGRDSSDVLFIDELPAPAPPGDERVPG